MEDLLPIFPIDVVEETAKALVANICEISFDRGLGNNLGFVSSELEVLFFLDNGELGFRSGHGIAPRQE